MKYIIVLCAFFIFVSNAFAGSGWTMLHVSNYKIFLEYNGSKIAEIHLDGDWKFYCLKGRKMGKTGARYSTLKKATQFAMSQCKK